MTSPRILVLVPAYNEEASLPLLLGELRALKVDAIVIDDCSTDNTIAVARQYGVPVLDLPTNLGIGGAVQTGFKYAAKNNYDIVVQLDGDAQHDPTWLKTVVAPIVAGTADCSIGSRYVPHQRDLGYKTPFARRVGMKFSTSILFLASGLTVHDTTSGFRALSQAAFTFFSRNYPVDHPEAEALLVLHRARFRIVEVPIKMRQRVHGTSLFNFRKSIMYPLRVIVGFMGVIFSKGGKA